MANHIRLIGCSIVVMALLFRASEATEYDVGDSFGWNIPPNQSFYSDWASSKAFVVGDSLVFNWTGNQNMIVVTKADYGSCSTNVNQFGSSNLNRTVFKVSLLYPGARYFICTIDDHCTRGQKFSIDVEGADSDAPAAQPPSSSASTMSCRSLSAFLSIIAVYFFTRV